MRQTRRSVASGQFRLSLESGGITDISVPTPQPGCYVVWISNLVFLVSEQEGRMFATIEWLRFSAASVVIAASTCGAISARATDVVTEWSTIQMPPPPTLKPVTVDSKSTALFLLDFMHENCGQRPRCVAAVPTIKALHDRARAAGMFVAYTLPGGGKIIDETIA